MLRNENQRFSNGNIAQLTSFQNKIITSRSGHFSATKGVSPICFPTDE